MFLLVCPLCCLQGPSVLLVLADLAICQDNVQQSPNEAKKLVKLMSSVPLGVQLGSWAPLGPNLSALGRLWTVHLAPVLPSWAFCATFSW